MSDDINGKFLIKIYEGRDATLEGDYGYVNFNLPVIEKLDSSDVYLYGEISNWQFSPAFKMNYIDECGCYQKTLLCKQGYYNYLYFVKENEPINYSPLLIEGSHFETKNNYQLFFYTSDINSRYDHLSGYLNTDN